jgi:hypothetical protein
LVYAKQQITQRRKERQDRKENKQQTCPVLFLFASFAFLAPLREIFSMIEKINPLLKLYSHERTPIDTLHKKGF